MEDSGKISNPKDHPRPVACFESGEGLPYAPEHFPNRGDIWTWKVGQRIKPSGYFQDRYLLAPKRLQETPKRKMWFLSKISLKSFIMSNFPDADFDAFFSSFIWQIPASLSSAGQDVNNRSQSPSFSKETARRGGASSQKRKSKPKPQRRKYIKKQIHSNITNTEFPDVSIIKEENLESNDTSKELGIFSLKLAPALDDNATKTPVTSSQLEPATPLKDSHVEPTLEDFDSYVNSLDDLLSLPLQRSLGISFGSSKEKNMSEARMKLVNLLHIGFPALFTSDKLTEVSTLSKELQDDPTLSAEELSMLKLIQEIPLASNDFLEAKRVAMEADKFFSDCEAKLACASTLRDEYTASKKEIAELEDEGISTSSEIRDIDEKIAVLQARRAAFVKVANRTNEKIAGAKSKQRRAMDNLPKIVSEIQAANSQTSEWKAKKQKSAEKEVEILTKFSPLSGFF